MFKTFFYVIVGLLLFAALSCRVRVEESKSLASQPKANPLHEQWDGPSEVTCYISAEQTKKYAQNIIDSALSETDFKRHGVTDGKTVFSKTEVYQKDSSVDLEDTYNLGTYLVDQMTIPMGAGTVRLVSSAYLIGCKRTELYR